MKYSPLPKNLEMINFSMPTIASMLDTTENNIEVFSGSVFSKFTYNMWPEFADSIIEKRGFPNTPFVRYGRSHSCPSRAPGSGICLYKTRRKNIKYVVINYTLDISHSSQYFFVKKGDVFKLTRYMIEQDKKPPDDIQLLPILHKAYLDDIINNTLTPIKKILQYKKYVKHVKKGVLFTGPPGNGKTLMCKYIKAQANLLGILTCNVTMSSIEKTFSEGRDLREIFDKAGIIFVDDVELSHLDRSQGKGSLACSILSAMDGISSMNQSRLTLRIFTTNEDIKCIDKAFTRPGRIDCIFNFGKPDDLLRERLIVERWNKEIVNYLENIRINRHSSGLNYLIEFSDGFSFAELDSIQSIMVCNKICSNNDGWDLMLSLKEYNRIRESLQENTKKNIGFIAQRDIDEMLLHK